MRRFLLPLLLLAFALPQVASAKPRRRPKKPKPTKPEPPKAEEEADEEETTPEPPARPGTAPAKPGSTPAGKPGAPATTPSATDPSKPPAPDINAPPPPAEGDGKGESAIDVDSLRKRYLELRDQLFRSRARAAALGSSLYSTRIRLHLDYK